MSPRRGPYTSTVAIVLMVLALFVGGGVAKGFISADELADDPAGTVWKMFEPTVNDLRSKWERNFG
jgi:hypothetical protein